MLHIYWIKPEGKSLELQAKHFLAGIKATGATFEFFEISRVSSKNTIFFNGIALKHANVVFLSGFSNSNYAEIFKALKLWAGGQRFPMPVCLVSDERLKDNVDATIALGFDDFVLLTEPLEFLAERLKLRQHHIQHQLKIEKLIQEQAAKNAKTETILSQREEFLSVCAHDLRSPLGLIQSSLSLVLSSSDGNLTEIQTELIHRARRQSGEAINLVNDLLDVMSFEQGLKPQYQLFSLDSLLRPFHQDYQFQAQQKGIHFHYNNSLVDWRVLADSDRIRQLMQNLVVNAMKFTEKGKNIFLNVSQFLGRRKSDPPYPMLVVSIKDEGRGIPHKELQKIFDRFTQIKEQSRSEGRGLGLTVAKQISTLHDGNIWVESEEGIGSTFFVLFPHVISRTMAPDFALSAHEIRKILVIEPSQKKREAYFEILKRWGFEVIFGNDGVEAVTLSFHHLPHLVILTGGLSKLGEAQVADTLKSDPLTANMKVIVAGESPEKFNADDYEFPFDGVLQLPFNQSHLENVFRDLGVSHPFPAPKVA
jgi:two-component system, sensor histidine kinase and response regulator